jgi:hypothetical protein
MIPIEKRQHGRTRRIVLIAAFSIIFLFVSLFILADQMIFFQRSAAFASGVHVRIPVLSYHSIGPNVNNKYVVTPDKFDEQMRTLHNSGYHSINLEQFDRLMKGKDRNDGKSVLITFDDGYADNYTKAFPIMNKYGFHATVFVVTKWVGSGEYLSWKHLKELQQAGWDIMSHTQTHPYLPLHSYRDQLKEIVESKKDIERHLSSKVNVIAYPYGFRSEETVSIVSGSGYSYAFTFDDGLSDSTQNPFLLKRIFVSGQEDLAAFQRKL